MEIGGRLQDTWPASSVADAVEIKIGLVGIRDKWVIVG